MDSKQIPISRMDSMVLDLQAACSEDGKLFVWHVSNTGLAQCIEAHAGGLGITATADWFAVADTVMGVHCHPHLPQLTTCSTDKTIKIWEHVDPSLMQSGP